MNINYLVRDVSLCLGRTFASFKSILSADGGLCNENLFITSMKMEGLKAAARTGLFLYDGYDEFAEEIPYLTIETVRDAEIVSKLRSLGNRWFESQIKACQEKLSDNAKTYIKTLLTEAEHDSRLTESCGKCEDQRRCLYIFKEILSFLTPAGISFDEVPTLLTIIEPLQEGIKQIITESYRGDEEKPQGWSWTTRGGKFDPYITTTILFFVHNLKNLCCQSSNVAETLSSLYSWIDDWFYNSDRFEECLKSIMDTQEDKVEKESLLYPGNGLGRQELASLRFAPRGGWREHYLMESPTFRIFSTTRIASMLSALATKSNRRRWSNKVVEVYSFIKGRADHEESGILYPPFIDVVQHPETQYKTNGGRRRFWYLSDIGGTLAVLNFFLGQGTFSPNSEQILTLVRWLLRNQTQNEEGNAYWSVCSSKCYKKYCRSPFPVPSPDKKESLTNTVLAISALGKFLEAILVGLSERTAENLERQ